MSHADYLKRYCSILYFIINGGTENSFDGQFVSGQNIQTLMDGWTSLNNKMMAKWQQKYTQPQETNATYYARLNVDQTAQWGQWENKLKKMSFLENLVLQGAMPGQLLLSFTYSDTLQKLIDQFDNVGFVWVPVSDTLGTLKQKDSYENTL